MKGEIEWNGDPEAPELGTKGGRRRRRKFPDAPSVASNPPLPWLRPYPWLRPAHGSVLLSPLPMAPKPRPKMHAIPERKQRIHRPILPSVASSSSSTSESESEKLSSEIFGIWNTLHYNAHHDPFPFTMPNPITIRSRSRCRIPSRSVPVHDAHHDSFPFTMPNPIPFRMPDSLPDSTSRDEQQWF